MSLDVKKQKQKEASKRWYDKNKEKIKLKRKGNRKQENLSYYQKIKKEKGLEFIRERSKEYRENNREKVRATLKRYRLNHPERKLFYGARQRAKKKGLDFNIEITDIVIPEYCPILEVKLEMLGQCDNSPSLDRIDNNKGYIKDNIWVISFKANRMKNTATTEELITFSKNINKIKQAIGDY